MIFKNIILISFLLVHICSSLKLNVIVYNNIIYANKYSGLLNIVQNYKYILFKFKIDHKYMFTNRY